MSELTVVIVLSLCAGAAMPIGAVLAKYDRLKPSWLGTEWRHFIIAFGGGALLSAIALVLVPEGSKELHVAPAAIYFGLGGLFFCWLDIYLAKKKSSAGQMVAMLSDFIPEAIALGAAFATGQSAGVLLAVLIALQNAPEGFNSFEELASSSKLSPNKIISAFAAMALLGPVAGVIGYFWLAASPHALAALMLFASGGILYLVFDDIAPQAKLNNKWMPALGAVAGFLLGLMGNMLVGA
ncbi:ZIP family metal transporter [Aliidiomarina quisquiliarum]|uniref:ZIP family metal transporter n=1 Tax=Aliidiomarina quisquiliarum TaxID=2938947 RepID=UPI00208DFA75|nr:divalent cation transporter [Aliidiomarina quisquiliarum]MCO4320532.1 divalent cation transporter [Aliidiomarina quisquiliarum]